MYLKQEHLNIYKKNINKYRDTGNNTIVGDFNTSLKSMDR